MSIKTKQTTRKFYNKWNYKLSFSIKNSRELSYRSLEYLAANGSNPLVASIAQDLLNYDSSSYSKRIESKILDLYTNDENFFNYFLEKYQQFTRLSVSPAPGNAPDDSHVILSKKLPHDRYLYKVFLQPHKIQSVEEKQKYLDWLETQKPRVNFTDTVKNWFYKTHWNWDRRYMYVEDEKTLLMLKLKKPEALGTIYTFVVSDK
jgi:hypothetical protein